MKNDLQENSACQAALLDIRKVFRELETISLQISHVNSAINALYKRENEHKKDVEEKMRSVVNSGHQRFHAASRFS